MTREELIAALESATGPSDDLDLAIAEWCYRNGAVAGVNYDPQLWILRNGGEFTASLDFALALVPEGWSWSLYAVIGKPASVRMWCSSSQDVLVSGATPALALAAAALKAQGGGA